MSYRSLKRVLGETSLERKCRLLFGACLLLLITGSFWWYGKATERLVIDENNKSTGRILVDVAMQKHHFRNWENDKYDLEWVIDLTEDLENAEYTYEFLASEEEFRTLDESKKKDIHAAKENDEKILRRLKTQYDVWLQEIQQADSGGNAANAPTIDASQSGPGTESSMADADVAMNTPALPSVGHRLRDRKGWKYHYYQPVYWKESCNTFGCHQRIQDLGAVPIYEAVSTEELPFRVIKIVVPYAATQDAINMNRAILTATAIITVFLAMVALYIVVRYVIVKPLQHLRNVSDQIASGNYLVRAEIRTNDEFEDLAHSFNRMLRNMVDAHEELRNVNADLDAKVDQLAQANMQLYEGNRLKSEFLANMSHELRTPLNSIIGFSDVLQSIESLNDKQKRYVRNIGQSGRVLLDMINDILDLAKMESGKMAVGPTEFSIETVVQAQCNLVRSLSEERNIDLEVEIAARFPKMYQDQGKVQQILTNLLSNSIKFTPEGGRIVVEVDRREATDELSLCVTDTGVGIAEEDQEVIFEKFRQGTALRQGDDLTREYSGTGLGLSIVKELCKLLGGEITFESELGKGSAFTVRLPWSLPEQPFRDVMAVSRGSQPSTADGAEATSTRRPDETPSTAGTSAVNGSSKAVANPDSSAISTSDP